MRARATGDRARILYLAPWVDYGGSDKGTIDWFRWMDRGRFAPSLVTTQPSSNRRLAEIVPYAEEVWPLPDHMTGEQMPRFIFDFICSRGVKVLHVMNSRLGYDLLPDLACLPDPPKVVVQLHVEEADRSGYVRYVTTRYGNLVDCFSVTSAHLADAVSEYGVPRDRIRVIYTGVDAEDEFSPNRAAAVEGLPGDRVHILYPGRLVEQKDPLLMVEVAAALRDRGMRFQLHAVGEGELEQEVRGRIAEYGLSDHVVVHPPTPSLQRWYAACDILLMTSAFEGVPYTIFEAMAMGLPVVAPALPGNRELVADGDRLVDPRDSVEGYVAALAKLLGDESHRSALGREGRARMRERFSLQRMADDHSKLYEELLAGSEPPAAAPDGDAARPIIRFRDRQLFGTPLVSIVVPHFNQGRFLVECIQAIRAQTYPEIEVIVVDDASTDGDAREALRAVEAHDDVMVVRCAENGGPSRARNVGIDRASGRYLLPVDADNLLLPDAVENLVAQLSTAGEEVGFIYPNLQYFGNREDYYEPPAFNLYELTRYNYCDTCSLFDRAIFDAGERFLEDIRLGHEDWEFVLRLAARGVRGERARGPTLRYRKWGFNRSDAVEYAGDAFEDVMAKLSPFGAFEKELKAEAAPAVSLMLLDPVDAGGEVGRRLARRLVEQSCIDIELIARFDGVWPAPRAVPEVRRISPALAATPAEALGHARSVARGYVLAATCETGSALLADQGFVEKMLRRFTDRPELDAIALVDAGSEGRYPFRPLEPDDAGSGTPPHTVIWRRSCERRLPSGLCIDSGDPIASIARLLIWHEATVEWRHLALRRRRQERRTSAGQWVAVADPPRDTTPGVDRRRLQFGDDPLLPGARAYVVPRWLGAPTWVPPQSVLLCRHRELTGARRIVTNDRRSPDGFEAEWDLGVLRLWSFEGTARIIRIGDDYTALPRGEWHSAPAEAEELGYVELAPFPLLDALALAVHRPTGQRTLVTLPEDPLLGEVDLIRGLGYIERFPVRPHARDSATRPYGLLGLTKAADYAARRHRYAVGRVPQGELVGELGALADSPLPGTKPVWLIDERLVAEDRRPPSGRPPLAAAVRWSGAPARWWGFSEPLPKARAIARRSLETARLLAVPPAPVAGPDGLPPAGWLGEEMRPGHAPLYVSYHPVTRDQLITRSPLEATDLGYAAPELLGYLREVAPVTGSLDQRPLPLPWASRFGMTARRG
jgi:glycosyltransferase involved in cell wall biosynthesis